MEGFSPPFGNARTILAFLQLEFGSNVMWATVLKGMDMLFVMETMNGVYLFQHVKVNLNTLHSHYFAK